MFRKCQLVIWLSMRNFYSHFTKVTRKCECFGCILEPSIMISYTYHILGVKFLKPQIYIWFNDYYMLRIAGYFLILHVPVTEYISEISTRDKHRKIYKLFVHICTTLSFYMCIFRHFECLDGNENYIYTFVVHLNKGHLSFFCHFARPLSVLLASFYFRRRSNFILLSLIFEIVCRIVTKGLHDLCF